VPWVKLSVKEDDVSGVSEISSGVPAAKEIKSPVIHWRQAVLLLAVLSEAVLVEVAPVPSVTISQRHWQLVAGLNLPCTSVKNGIRISLIIQLKALISLPDEVHGREPLNVPEIEICSCCITVEEARSILATRVKWPGRKWLQERGGVWIVHHSHAAKIVGDHFDEGLDVLGYGDGRVITEVELLGDVIISRVDVLSLDEVVEALLVPCHAFLSELCSNTLISDGVVCMRVEVLAALEPEDGGARRDGSVEGRWVLHSEPRCKHATVGTAEDVDWSPWIGMLSVIVVAALGLDVFKKSNIVHHNLLDGKILQVLRLQCLLSRIEWIRLAVVSVLAEHNGGVEPLGKCPRHESRIIIEAFDGALVTGVEKDGSRLIWIELLVHDVAEGESLRLIALSGVEMVEARVEGHGLWTLVISLDLFDGLFIPNASVSELAWIGPAPQRSKRLHLADLD